MGSGYQDVGLSLEGAWLRTAEWHEWWVWRRPELLP